MATFSAAAATCSRFSHDQHNIRQLLWYELGQCRVTAKQVDSDYKLFISPSYAKFLLDRPLQTPRSRRVGQHEVTLLPRQQSNANLEL